MCGISLIVNKEFGDVPDELIAQMNSAIVHRGPDGEGFFFGNNFAMGHRRLSIIDMSKDASQPMSYMSNYTITYNGEIYNYKELRKELQEKGMEFSTLSDTEVILAAYAVWGEQCVTHFNGMWSFVLYDRNKGILFCSRDRFGVKPFYFYESDKYFVVGSEIKQILPFLDSRVVNLDAVLDYLVLDFVEHTKNTFFKNVEKLPAGHSISFDLANNCYEITKYYDLEEQIHTNSFSERDIESEILKQLKQSISIRLRSDVPVGTCLSGGLDSSSIASLASSLYNNEDQFIAITAKATELEYDESEYAQRVAECNNLSWKVVVPQVSEFKENIDKVILVQEEPFCGPSIFMQNFVMKKAAELGCKVMLDGQGGDEVFLGYERYYPAVYREGLMRNPLSLFRLIQQSVKNNSAMTFGNVVKYSCGCFFPSLRLSFANTKCGFLKRKYRSKSSILQRLKSKYSSVKTLQAFEIKLSNLPALLRYEDKNSMSHSVEARLPMLDYKLVEYMLQVEGDLKMKNGWSKFLLRKVMQNKLPENVVWRKGKLGFNAPDLTWLSSHSAEMKNEVINSKILNRICKHQALVNKYDRLSLRLQWRLFNIARWEKLFDVSC